MNFREVPLHAVPKAGTSAKPPIQRQLGAECSISEPNVVSNARSLCSHHSTLPSGVAPQTNLSKVDDLREFLEARLGGSWLALPEEAWSEWWRTVSREEASKRYRQIQAESDLVRDEWFATWEGRSAFAPGGYPQWDNLYSLVFVRKLSALFFAPQLDESEVQFQERSAEGRMIDRYYQPLFQEQRQDFKQEALQVEEQLAGVHV